MSGYCSQVHDYLARQYELLKCMDHPLVGPRSVRSSPLARIDASAARLYEIREARTYLIVAMVGTFSRFYPDLAILRHDFTHHVRGLDSTSDQILRSGSRYSNPCPKTCART